MVSAYTGEDSMIVDPLGRVLAKSSSYSPVICKNINLDYGVFHVDYNHVKCRVGRSKTRSSLHDDVEYRRRNS